MANVRPFSALRFDFERAGAPEALCCPPYDIIPDPAPWLAKGAYNMIRLEGGERLGSSDPYGEAARLLSGWKNEGILRRDDAPGYYLYEITFTSRDGTQRSLWGFFARVELRPWADGVVRPHEHTLSAAKEDRRRLMNATGCHFSPIYSLHRDPEGLINQKGEELRAKAPLCDFTDGDGLRHRLWLCDEPAFCDALTKAYAPLPLYIADGHHRYETSLRMREEGGDAVSPYVLMFLCPSSHPGLEVHATHRLLSGLENYDEAALPARLAKDFTLVPDDKPRDGEPVWLSASGSWRLVPHDASYTGLDVSLLHDRILEPLFGVDAANMAAGRNLRYTRDEEEARALVREGKVQCAFLLAPTRVEQILDTADAKGVMPQKSTYFYPKLLTGLVMHEFRETEL